MDIVIRNIDGLRPDGRAVGGVRGNGEIRRQIVDSARSPFGLILPRIRPQRQRLATGRRDFFVGSTREETHGRRPVRCVRAEKTRFIRKGRPFQPGLDLRPRTRFDAQIHELVTRRFYEVEQFVVEQFVRSFGTKRQSRAHKSHIQNSTQASGDTPHSTESLYAKFHLTVLSDTTIPVGQIAKV